MSDPTQRFTDRADHYARYRPGYPAALLDLLRTRCGLQPPHAIADIGSGTGRLTQLLLTGGNRVYAVEPNAAMRHEAEALLGGSPGFHSLAGRSEATGLTDHSVDFITVAQAIHWFEPTTTLEEFRRILRPGGWLVVVNNKREAETSPLVAEVQAAIEVFRTAPEPGQGWWGWDDGVARCYYGPAGPALSALPNAQVLDEVGFLGRWLSQSTMPLPGHPRYDELLAAVREVFARHQVDGTVTVPYLTHVHYGRLCPGD